MILLLAVLAAWTTAPPLAAEAAKNPPPVPEPFVIELTVERAAPPMPKPFTVELTVIRDKASKIRKGCPGGHMCGSLCCPLDIPCWDRMAIRRAVQQGRCR